MIYTVEAIAEAGYNADTLVLSPGDALAIRLLIMSGGSTYAFSQTLRNSRRSSSRRRSPTGKGS